MKQLQNVLWPISVLFFLILFHSCLTNTINVEKFVSFSLLQFRFIFKLFHLVIIIIIISENRFTWLLNMVFSTSK